MKLFKKSILAVCSALLLLSLAVFAAACGGGKTVGYTVEIWLAADGGYELSAEKSSSGSGEIGKELTLSAPAIEGYVFNAAHNGNVATLTLSEDESGNVFKFYYDEEIKDLLQYDANAPRGAAASGAVASGAAENGKATAAENGFSVQGYRFAGWSYTKNGAAEVQPGDEVEVSGTVTLYAVWDRGYLDRFGGTDLIFLPSNKSGVLVMQRGGAEFETTVQDSVFSFDLPNETTVKGKLFDDNFAYAQKGLAGTYSYHSSYFNKDSDDGTVEPDPKTTLTLDEYGSATYSYIDESGRQVSETGYITYYSYGDNPEYLFVIDGGTNAGSGFIFRFDRSAEGVTYYTTTNGEAGEYTFASTPDGYIFYPGYFGLYLDGYGSLYLSHSDYTGEWLGRYWIDGMYSVTDSLQIYKLHLLVNADNKGYLSRLHSGVVDGLLSVTCYTMPLGESDFVYFVYAEPNAEEGTYKNETDGSTLVLDGFKNFADSAIYTVDGTTHYGSYETIWSQTDNLTIVMHENSLDGTYTGTDRTFKIALKQYELNGQPVFDICDTFTVLGKADGASYRLLNKTGFGDEVIVISETPYEGESGAYKAEYGKVSAQGGFTKLADGYVTGNTKNCPDLYTFTRTTDVSAGDVPKSMIFQLGSSYDSNFFLYDVYFVFSVTYDDASKDVQYYVEITDADGSNAVIWYAAPPDPGMLLGTVYFDADGKAYVGNFSTAEDYFGKVGTLTVVDANGAQSFLYFDLEYNSDGSPATFTAITEREYPLITVYATGELDMMVHFMVRGDEGMYSKSGDFEGSDVVRGSIKYVEENAAGEGVMAFVNGEGIELFRYVTDSMLYSEPGYVSEYITVYYTYDSSLAKTYSSSEGTLKLDGFRNAEYTDEAGDLHTGTYTVSANKQIVSVNAGTRRYTFDIAEELTLTDGVYGTYAMNAGGGWWDVTFDGHGNATAKLGSRTEQGIYRAEESGEVVLFLNIVAGVNSYRLRLSSYEGHGEAAVFDENLSGAFIGDNWTVLFLDGFGGGSYYFADGSGWTTVYYNVLDEEIGYINIRDTASNAQNIVLNAENKTLSYPEYVEKDYVYYGEDLSALIVGKDGTIYMNYTSGYYIFAEGVNRAYLLNDSAEFYPVDLGGKPQEGVWTVNGKTYYPWQSGQTVTLTGTVEVDYEEEANESRSATLTFPLTGEDVMEMRGALTVGDEKYDVDLISTYYDGDRHGLSVVDWSQYEYSAITEYKYTGNGAGTMKIVVTAKQMTMYDAFEEQDGNTSFLEEYRVGFGPINITSRKLSGHVYVGNNTYLDFEDKDIETTYYYESDQGRRYNIIFESGGETYSMQYNKEDSDYRLYLIGTYKKITAGNYSVGVINYYYSNGSYTFDYKKGDLCDFILYNGTGEDAAPIVAMSKGLSVKADKTTAKGWYLDIGKFDPVTQSGEPGKIYTVAFTANAASATVTEYDFMQAADEENAQYANLCLGENGEVKDIVVLINGDSFYDVEHYEYNEDLGGYIVTCDDGATLLLKLPVDDEGEHLTNTDGSWQMTAELYEPAAE